MTIEWVEIGRLTPNLKNPNKHSKEQIERLTQIIKYQGWRHPIIVDKNYTIWAGHGRLLAAKKLRLEKVPIHVQEFIDEDQAYAFLVSDNAIASWAELDLSAINLQIPEFDPEFDIDLLGIKDFEIEPADKYDNDESDYSQKIESPIYEIKGEKPAITELVDTTKTKELTKKIKNSNLPEELKSFLSTAALRHNVFNYAKIAEYYAHADAEMKSLMEDSALVIIDFNKAIESGFVILTEELAGAYLDEK
jgi:hypothetical protein